ncbi:MAG: dienelactone hydrolase family protein [Bryobacterales bacterium]|nr:dienelactone hydrolase family protein [Bryobacterales bacterium]
MRRLYRRWISDWENDLCFRATNRVVRPFDWGLDWAEGWPVAQQYPRNGHGPEEYLRLLNQEAIRESESFFGYETPSDFALDGEFVRCTSPVRTPHAENNTIWGRWFPAKKPSGKAVIVLPHWNSHASQHVGLCKGLQALGLSVLRVSLPYHDNRMPPELQRADYAVSSNLARTIDATRQAVIDTRALIDWLEQQGHDRIGIVGTSLGSCYAFLVSAHDARLKVNVYNHCSSYFSDVVWTGLSTKHIREGLEGNIDADGLREAWMAISPVSYLDRYARLPKKSMFIYTTYDTTFLPHLSEDVIRKIREHGIENRVVVLPCGHYTMGEAPFKFIDGYYICSFLKRWL